MRLGKVKDHLAHAAAASWRSGVGGASVAASVGASGLDPVGAPGAEGHRVLGGNSSGKRLLAWLAAGRGL